MNLSLTLEPEFLRLFFPFLRQGVTLRGITGLNVEAFLCEQLGADIEYVHNRLQTIFLNGKAVDNLAATIVQDGATLTLSAAMPGLAGATLRRGGYLASMREGISCPDQGESATLSKGRVTLKLLNLITGELGPEVLGKGVWIKGTELGDFFSRQSDPFWKGCGRAELDGEGIDPSGLARREWPEEEVFLKVSGS